MVESHSSFTDLPKRIDKKARKSVSVSSSTKVPTKYARASTLAIDPNAEKKQNDRKATKEELHKEVEDLK